MRTTELFHHGIKGQQWGVKNGPPYPLDNSKKSNTEKKTKSKNVIRVKLDKVKKWINENTIPLKDVDWNEVATGMMMAQSMQATVMQPPTIIFY